jgi:hypothetical protein
MATREQNGSTACGGIAIAWMLAAATAAQAGVSSGGGASSPSRTIRLTELRVDQQGADNDEYFELLGTPGGSLAGVWLLAIGDSGTDPSGVVEAAIDLSSWTLGSNGRFVGHEASFGSTTFGGTMLTVDPKASHAVVGSGDSINFENSDTVTYLLVRAFRGSVGIDLDGSNDGTFDAVPWSELIDSVAFVRSGSSEPTYSDVTVGPIPLTATGGMPPHAWLGPKGWTIGEYGSWSADTPGSGPDVPAPGAAASLACAAMATGRRGRLRS